jgi:hypothetical protein
MILLISASHVARIIDMSHQHPAQHCLLQARHHKKRWFQKCLAGWWWWVISDLAGNLGKIESRSKDFWRVDLVKGGLRNLEEKQWRNIPLASETPEGHLSQFPCHLSTGDIIQSMEKQRPIPDP